LLAVFELYESVASPKYLLVFAESACACWVWAACLVTSKLLWKSASACSALTDSDRLLEVEALSEARAESAADLAKLALTEALADALWLALAVSL
jgi:hypothetical protein